MNFSFKLLAKDKKTKARVGEIRTPHGKIKTPAFVPVGTQASVKTLTPQELRQIGIQTFFVNTYHMYLRPGVEVVEKLGGLHKFMGWDGPIMTDSGGFQVFSLGREKNKKLKIKKKNYKLKLKNEEEVKEVVKIDNDGVTFKSHWDGSIHRFTPEKSIRIQQKLGADLIMAFDECAPYPTTPEYAKRAMQRTHHWALRSLTAAQDKHKKRKTSQALFGIIQGSVYKDLRIESAKFISSLPFEGMAIGGVSVGESKREMRRVLDWVIPFLPEEKPRHLLGVGEIDDIFAAIERGVDTMDCVMPTRLGRMGWILTKSQNFRYDITKAEFASDSQPPEPGCQCFTCQNFSKAYLHHLFRASELLAYRLATYHNLHFLIQLFHNIREAIKKGSFLTLKEKWLKKGEDAKP